MKTIWLGSVSVYRLLCTYAISNIPPTKISIWKYRIKVINIPIKGNNTEARATFTQKIMLKFQRHLRMIIIYELIWALLCCKVANCNCENMLSHISKTKTRSVEVVEEVSYEFLIICWLTDAHSICQFDSCHWHLISKPGKLRILNCKFIFVKFTKPIYLLLYGTQSTESKWNANKLFFLLSPTSAATFCETLVEIPIRIHCYWFLRLSPVYSVDYLCVNLHKIPAEHHYLLQLRYSQTKSILFT